MYTEVQSNSISRKENSINDFILFCRLVFMPRQTIKTEQEILIKIC